MPQYLKNICFDSNQSKQKGTSYLFFYIIIIFLSFLTIDILFRYLNYGYLFDSDFIHVILFDLLWTVIFISVVLLLPRFIRVVLLSTIIFFIAVVATLQTVSINLTNGVSSLINVIDIIVSKDIYTIMNNFSFSYLLFFIPFIVIFSLSVSTIKLAGSLKKRFILLLLTIVIIISTGVYSSNERFSNDVETNTNLKKLLYFEEVDSISSRLGISTFTIRGIYNEFLKEKYYNLPINTNLLGQLDSYMNKGKSKDNDYTGILKNKNLILIQVDSLDYSALNDDIMPTLTRLMSEGMHFTNYYSSYLIENGDTEFAVQTGIIPTDRNNNVNQFRNNGFTDSMVQLFNNFDYPTMSVYSGSSNERYDFYNNLGYDLYLDNYNLGIKNNDSYELINETSKIYLDKPRFFINYHISYPGNYVYKNFPEEFNELEVSDKLKNYLFTARNFDYALNSLINNLTTKNNINNTAIVIYGTHSPVNMLGDDLLHLSNVDRNGLNKYKAPLIIWSPNIKSEVVLEHIGPVDILPTLANMLDLSANYNSYIGEDIFSSGNNVVYFRNRSWISNAGEYNTMTQQFTVSDDKYLTDFLKIYIKNTNLMVEEKFTYSRIILERNYFVQIKV